jgi:hypothetical protein
MTPLPLPVDFGGLVLSLVAHRDVVLLGSTLDDAHVEAVKADAADLFRITTLLAACSLSDAPLLAALLRMWAGDLLTGAPPCRWGRS